MAKPALLLSVSFCTMSLTFPATPVPFVADASDAAVQRDLVYLRQMVKQSAKLAALGVHDDFAQQVKQMHEDPINAWMDVLQKAEAQLWAIIQGIVLDFLNQRRDLLTSVYRVQRPGVLEYVLVLAQPGLDSEFELDELLQTYEQTVLAPRFPVVFHYLKPELVADLQHVETVNIGE